MWSFLPCSRVRRISRAGLPRPSSRKLIAAEQIDASVRATQPPHQQAGQIAHDELPDLRMTLAKTIKAFQRKLDAIYRGVGPDIGGSMALEQRHLAECRAWHERCQPHAVGKLHAYHPALEEENGG